LTDAQLRGNANDSVWKGTYFWLTILSKKNFALTILGRARPTNYIGPGRRPAITILGWAGGPQTILGRRPTNYIGPQAHKLYWAGGPQTILGRRPTNYIGPQAHKLYWAAGPQTILGRRPTNYIGSQAHKLYWAACPQIAILAQKFNRMYINFKYAVKNVIARV